MADTIVQNPEAANPAAVFLADIPFGLARAAFKGTSFSPEKRADSWRASYGAELAGDYELFRQNAEKGGTLDLLEQEFARYRAGARQRFTRFLASNSRCVSSFIAGPSNFPAARMNKRADIAHRRLGEYCEFRERARAAVIRKLRPDLAPIMASDPDAIERYEAELAKLKAQQERMRAANAAIRANKKAGLEAQIGALMELGFAEPVARKLIEPDFCGRIGFPDYMLKNNGANIRRIEKRVALVAKLQATPVAEYEGSAARIEFDPPANRVRLYFPGKPSFEIRSELKQNGFRWAPTIGAWQAYYNSNAAATARKVAA
jgi:hypothetical protein